MIVATLSNPVYAGILALAVIAVLLTVFRVKWLPAARRKRAALFSWFSGKQKN